MAFRTASYVWSVQPQLSLNDDQPSHRGTSPSGILKRPRADGHILTLLVICFLRGSGTRCFHSTKNAPAPSDTVASNLPDGSVTETKARIGVWSHRKDLNLRPAAYEAAALPTELLRRDPLCAR